MPSDARGCQDRWACCGQAPEELGCVTVCLRCNVRWGHKPGCQWPEVDDDNDEKGNGNATVYHDADEPVNDDYDEEANPLIAQERQMERQMQIEKELTPLPMLGSVPMVSAEEEEVEATSSPRSHLSQGSHVGTLPTENLL